MAHSLLLRMRSVRNLGVAAGVARALLINFTPRVTDTQRQAYYSELLQALAGHGGGGGDGGMAAGAGGGSGSGGAGDTNTRVSACVAWLVCCLNDPTKCMRHVTSAMGVEGAASPNSRSPRRGAEPLTLVSRAPGDV